jgi:hypothetical protein
MADPRFAGRVACCSSVVSSGTIPPAFAGPQECTLYAVDCELRMKELREKMSKIRHEKSETTRSTRAFAFVLPVISPIS